MLLKLTKFKKDGDDSPKETILIGSESIISVERVKKLRLLNGKNHSYSRSEMNIIKTYNL